MRFSLTVLIGFSLSSLLAQKDAPHLAVLPGYFEHYQNPAFAGIRGRPAVQLNYAMPWPSISRSDQIIAGYDQALGEDRQHGIGLSYQWERFTYSPRHQVNVSYSRVLRFSDDLSFRAGASIHYSAQKIDRYNYNFSDNIDPFFGFVRESAEHPPSEIPDKNLSADLGFFGIYKNLFAGVSARRLMRLWSNGGSDQNQQYFPLEPSAVAGYEIRLPRDFSLIPMLTVHKTGAAPLRLSPSFFLNYDNFLTLGIQYANLNELKLDLGFYIAERVSLIGSIGTFTDPTLFELSFPSFLRTGAMLQF